MEIYHINGYNCEIICEYFDYDTLECRLIIEIKNGDFDIDKFINDAIFNIEFYDKIFEYFGEHTIFDKNSQINFQSLLQNCFISDNSFSFYIRIENVNVEIRLFYYSNEEFKKEIEYINNIISKKTNMNFLNFHSSNSEGDLYGILNTRAIEKIEAFESKNSIHYSYENAYGHFLITEMDLENDILEQIKDNNEKERIKKLYTKCKFNNL